MEKTKNIVIIVLFLIIALLYTCGKGKPCPEPEVVYKDSIIVKTDTFWAPNKLNEFKAYKPVAKDSVKTIEYTIVDHGPCNYKRFYQDSLVDSNLVIYNSDTTLGLLLGKKTSYRLKIPQKIVITNTIIKTPEFKKRNKLFIGGEIGGNKNNFDISPLLLLENKKEIVYIYNYGLLSKTHNVGIAIKIR